MPSGSATSSEPASTAPAARPSRLRRLLRWVVALLVSGVATLVLLAVVRPSVLVDILLARVRDSLGDAGWSLAWDRHESRDLDRIRFSGMVLAPVGGRQPAAPRLEATEVELAIPLLALGWSALAGGPEDSAVRVTATGRDLRASLGAGRLRLGSWQADLGVQAAARSLAVSLVLADGAVDAEGLALLLGSGSRPGSTSAPADPGWDVSLGTLAITSTVVELPDPPGPLRIVRARLVPGPSGALPTISAELSVPGGGRGRLEVASQPASNLLSGTLAFEGLALAGLPLPSDPDLRLSGRFDGELAGTLDPAALADPSGLRGRLSMSGGSLRRGSQSMATGIELSARLEGGPPELVLRIPSLDPAGLGLPLPPHVAGPGPAPLAAELDDTRLSAAFGGRPEDRLSVGLRVSTTGILLELGGRRIPMPEPAAGLLDLELRGEAPRLPHHAPLAALASLVETGPARTRIRWTVPLLRVVSPTGDRLEFEEPLSGSATLAPPGIVLDETVFENRGAQVALSGGWGGSDSVVAMKVTSLDLGALLAELRPHSDLVVGSRMESGRLTVVPDPEGSPRLEAGFELAPDPRLAWWRRSREGIRRLELAPGLRSLALRADRGVVRVQVGGLEAARTAGPDGAIWSVRTPGLGLRLRDVLYPERRQLAAGELRVEADLEVPEGFPTRSRGHLVLAWVPEAVASTAIATATPATTPASIPVPDRGDARIEVTASGVSAQARLRDGLGAERLGFDLQLAGGESGRLGFRAARLPSALLPGLGIPAPPGLELDLEASGSLGLPPDPEGRPGLLARLAGSVQGWTRPPSQAGEARPPRGRGPGTPRLEAEVSRLEIGAGSRRLLSARSRFPFRIDGEGFAVGPAGLELGGQLVTLSGGLSRRGDRKLEAKVEAVPVEAWLGLLGLPEGVTGKGRVDGRLEVSGSPERPDFRGRLEVPDLALALPWIEGGLAGGLALESQGRTLVLASRSLALAGAPVNLSGSLGTDPEGRPQVRLEAKGDRLVLARGRSRLERIRLDASATCRLAPLEAQATLRAEIGGGELLFDDTGPVTLIRALAGWSPGGGSGWLVPGVAAGLDVEVLVPSPVRLRSPLVDTEWTGKFSLRAQPGRSPRISAFLEATRGSVFLHRTEFRIRRAKVDLSSDGAVSASQLELEADAQVGEHRVDLRVRGGIEAPEVVLTSSPTRSERELVHLLTTGALPGSAGALQTMGTGVRDFYLASSLNRFLSSSLGLSSIRIRSDGAVRRVDVDAGLDARTRLLWSEASDATREVRLEYRLRGSTLLEAGSRHDRGSGSGAVPFVGFKRRIRLR